jgi:uncharacterized protein (DUF58 family)
MSQLARFLDPNLIQRLNQLQLSARSVVEGRAAGSHRSKIKGASVDFRQHRIYAPGDEPRRLDWRLLARSDRHYVREYQEETNLRGLLMLDTSGSMRYGRQFGTKFDYAARIVASLAYLMLAQTESCGLAAYGARVDRWVAPQSHRSQLSRIIDVLERCEPDGPSSPDAAMHDAADRLEKRSLIVVLSDFFSPIDRIRGGIARLRHEGHEIIAMQVIDPDELEFPFRGFGRFRGLEHEAPALRDTSLLRQRYLENFRRHQQDLEQACRTAGVEFTRIEIDRPMDDVLIAFLRRRAMARR